ncbi:NAD(P)H-binding protein [Mucilaginibacter rubeus]|uniref:NAD(P)H-binding protein n=1 Tax=Mucilaginibacter rubeus TaxID=2027860 RepID=A0AAE6MJ76_9SPHI|nr:MULTISPECIES: NAD(P)H-binding protein [Mucilaginibacter]QEM04987.1 NAD(P)H-binding protein [Mucilaginibacter rubeus]QEM17581.1 NAD(P)H-binding protein [Mucilaginibacter gossypii]QTE45898.1 NAD(P)H-binding protein [Mucilaginibacter rubeus]QTE52495.1 NAD(P)H-binding protein [Mucilaginibacter rubeus]QTE57584.1 NAD(P)H-binding protein [Mucilaginibacter rubeus]
MKIILTGSLGNISQPLAKALAAKGHTVTVISSNADRKDAIEALGAQAAIGSLRDLNFLIRTFTGADIVYLMEPTEPGRFRDKTYDPYESVRGLVTVYKTAVEQTGVKKIVHLSSIGAHTDQGVGLLRFHHMAETILRSLPAEVAIKFMRPVGFYGNLLMNIDTIKTLSKGFIGAVMALQYYGLGGLLSGKRGVIVANYGGDTINLLVSPIDIAAVIAEEMEKPFEGRSFRYIASEEPTCSEVARILGEAIGKPYLKWGKISDKMLRNAMLKQGMGEMLADGLVEMGAAGRSGKLYEDYFKHRPVLGQTKLSTYAPVFAEAYRNSK